MSATITPAVGIDEMPHLTTAIPGPNSRAIHSRREGVVARGVGCLVPVYIESAEGPWVFDVDGNRLLDLGSGIGVTTMGHGNERVTEAAVAQLRSFTHTLFTVTPYEGYVRLAERLAGVTPGDFPKRTVLVNSGAEAVENAVKIARRHTGRRAIAALDYAFHGRTSLSMAMNHSAVPYSSGFGPFSPEVYRVPNSYPYRDGLTGGEAALRTISYLEKRIGANDLAAIIIEPIQGEGGFIVPAPGFLPALQRWATENGVVLIADEIQTGLARTGSWFASEHLALIPDIVLTAKALAGGLPLAGVTGRAEIMDSAAPGGLGGTFGGNPVAVAAALAVFDELENGDHFDQAMRIGRTLRVALEHLAEQHPHVGDIRGIGAMQALELSDPLTREPMAGLAAKVAAHAASRGVLLIPAGADGNVIRFLPTLLTSDAQLDFAIEVIGEALVMHTNP